MSGRSNEIEFRNIKEEDGSGFDECMGGGVRKWFWILILVVEWLVLLLVRGFWDEIVRNIREIKVKIVG